MSHGPLTRTLHVRVVAERSEGDHTRIVVTFDDAYRSVLTLGAPMMARPA